MGSLLQPVLELGGRPLASECHMAWSTAGGKQGPGLGPVDARPACRPRCSAGSEPPPGSQWGVSPSSGKGGGSCLPMAQTGGQREAQLSYLQAMW